MNCNEPLEIERRFLILRPSEDELKSRCSRIYQMEQTYLLAPPHQTCLLYTSPSPRDS